VDYSVTKMLTDADWLIGLNRDGDPMSNDSENFVQSSDGDSSEISENCDAWKSQVDLKTFIVDFCRD